MLQIKAIDNKNIWEKFLKEYSPQSLFQSWNWGETIRKIKYPRPRPARGGQKSNIKNLFRLGLYDGSILIGITQVIRVRAKKGTFLHVRHGPILKEWKKSYFEALFNYLKNLGKVSNAVFIRISPQLPNTEEYKIFFKEYKFTEAPIHRMDGEVCWVLDLNKPEMELLSGMRKTTRYLIKQAEKLGVAIIKTQNAGNIEAFLKLYDATAERHNFVKHAGIKEEFEIFAEDNKIMLFEGYYNNRLLASALIIFYNDQAIYHHSASIEQKIPVNYLLQWEVIKEAKKRGNKIYNLWGVAPEKSLSHPWRGLTLFKQGFGGRQVEYLHAMDYPLSIKYCATYVIESLRKFWKGY